jgi:glycerol-3-phosphate dehydrogenase
MLDDVMVRLVARAATRLGASYAEHTRVDAIALAGEGYRICLRSANGTREVTSRLVVNAAGAWANANLLRWNVLPRTVCLLNVGTHLVFSPEVVPATPDDCAATLMQHEDGRVVFFIPWDGKWLLGTTDSTLEGTPDRWDCPRADHSYLMEIAEQHFDLRQADRHILENFCGIRTIPLPDRVPAAGAGPVPSAWSQDPFASPLYRRLFKGDASSLSRESVIEESAPGLFTIYGGKFTTYRALCERLGDRIAQRLGHGGTSGTHDPRNWFLDELRRSEPYLFQSSAELRRNPC